MKDLCPKPMKVFLIKILLNCKFADFFITWKLIFCLFRTNKRTGRWQLLIIWHNLYSVGSDYSPLDAHLNYIWKVYARMLQCSKFSSKFCRHSSGEQNVPKTCSNEIQMQHIFEHQKNYSTHSSCLRNFVNSSNGNIPLRLMDLFWFDSLMKRLPAGKILNWE